MNSSSKEKEEWDSYYRENAPTNLPWETGKPDKNLVELIERGIMDKGRVLDICSGLGTQTIYLAKRGYEVYGIDISPTAVGIAQERCRDEKVTCNLTLGNAAELNFPNAFFTFVFDRGCFHSIKSEQREKFINGVRRVLRRNGKYFLSCFSWRNGEAWNHFTEADIRRYFSGVFNILVLKEDVFTVEASGEKVYFYSVLMEAK